MKLKRYTGYGHNIVDITGPLSSSDEIAMVEALMQKEVSHLIFRRIFVVHENIVRLLLRLQKEQHLKVTSDEIYLSTYLNKLGVKILYDRADNLFCRLKKLSQTKMVALTGSADSNDKVHEILKELPFSETLSICIVQHISSDAELLQDSILQPLTRYKVQYAEDGMPVKGGVVYIARPDHHLRVQQGIFRVGRDDAVNHARPSIDVTLSSLTDEYGSSAVGVVLCGYSVDGVEGSRYAVSKAMPLIIEEASECGANELVKHIKESGQFHLEATLEKIIHLLPVFASSDEQLLQTYIDSANALYGYDFRNYILDSIERRVNAALSKYSFSGQRQFFISTLAYKRRFKRLLMELSIPTTYFFREPDTWRFIKDEILPTFDRKNHLKIWSAGSSIGKEAYSMAMLAEQEGMLKNTLIYGTDLNTNSLTIAKNGLYPMEEIESLAVNFHASGGEGDIQRYIYKEEQFFSIAPRLRDHVFFFRHNLATEDSMNLFQIIFCNNVLIYFDTYLRDSVLELFKNSLIAGGYLIIGENENISGLQQEKHFKAVRKNIFRRI
ncbi:MAG: CheR family methyltransferase [Campylobacterota bacterium]|nr:CheR family methyltransferase [Campylobacterota bacterium]